jgi:uncharacterized repeat protein (TIGR02543 family)
VSLSGANSSLFRVNGAATATISSIAAEASETFTVGTATGLTGGSYTASVKVSGGSGIVAQSFNVSFTVNPTYTVTFDSNGGSVTYPPQNVADGGKAANPGMPSKTGLSFKGWYLPGAATPFNFTTTVINANITISAVWEARVQFDSTGGSIVITQYVIEGGTATSPAASKAGYTFANWYASTDYTTLFNFNTPVMAHTTVYAGWTPVTFGAVIGGLDNKANNLTLTHSLPNGNESYALAAMLITANSPAQVSINGNGRTVTGNANRITVGAGATLTLQNITLSNVPFTVSAGGKLVLESGAVIRQNTASDSTAGGGITVDGGTLEMKAGAVVTLNNAVQGGGVLIKGSGSTFTMDGGEIKSNGAAMGGGICIVGSSNTFTMNGGAIRENHTAPTASHPNDGGGGVVVGGADARVYINNGSLITGNWTSAAGFCGGVGLIGGSSILTMSGGEISGNSASQGGGVGLWIASGTRFNMSGGVIKNNEAFECGGGVMVMQTATFNMTGGEVTANTARSGTGQYDGGGGVYVYSNTAGYGIRGSGTLTGNYSVGSKDSGKGSIYGNTPDDRKDYVEPAM